MRSPPVSTKETYERAGFLRFDHRKLEDRRSPVSELGVAERSVRVTYGG